MLIPKRPDLFYMSIVASCRKINLAKEPIMLANKTNLYSQYLMYHPTIPLLSTLSTKSR